MYVKNSDKLVDWLNVCNAQLQHSIKKTPEHIRKDLYTFIHTAIMENVADEKPETYDDYEQVVLETIHTLPSEYRGLIVSFTFTESARSLARTSVMEYTNLLNCTTLIADPVTTLTISIPFGDVICNSDVAIPSTSVIVATIGLHPSEYTHIKARYELMVNIKNTIYDILSEGDNVGVLNDMFFNSFFDSYIPLVIDGLKHLATNYGIDLISKRD